MTIPRAGKFLLAGVIGLALFNTLDCGAIDLCGNEVQQVAPSPDGEFRAIVFRRGCGATTPFYTQVTVLESGVQFLEEPTTFRRTEAGNTLVMGSETEIRAEWRGPRLLLLRVHSGMKPVMSVSSIGEIVVEYGRPK